MVFQNRPSCVVTVLRRLRSIQKNKRFYHLVGSKKQKELEFLNSLLNEPCFKENTLSVNTLTSLISEIRRLSTEIFEVAEQLIEEGEKINEDNNELINKIIIKRNYHKNPAIIYHELKISNPGIQWDRNFDSYNEKEMVKSIIELLLGLEISEREGSVPTEKETKENQDRDNIELKMKEEEAESELQQKMKGQKRKLSETTTSTSSKKGTQDSSKPHPPSSNPRETIIKLTDVLESKNKREVEMEREQHVRAEADKIFKYASKSGYYKNEHAFDESQEYLQNLGLYEAEEFTAISQENINFLEGHLKAGPAKLVQEAFDKMMKQKM